MRTPHRTESPATDGPVTLDQTGGRVVVATEFGGPDVLRVVRRSTEPVPAANQVRITVLASSATLSDSIVRRGLSPYLGATVPPLPLGYDMVGRVDAVGRDVTDLVPGQLVVDVPRWGGNADLVLRPARALTPVTADIDPVVLEPLVMTGMTAWQMLRRIADVRPGQRVLVHGASGGVGLLCAQLALLLGAEVIGTASDWKLAPLAVHGIRALDRRSDLGAAIRTSAPHGVDVVIDGAGGDETLRVAHLLAEGGTLVNYGFAAAAAGAKARTPQTLARLAELMSRSARDLATVAARDRRAETYEVVGLRTAHPDWYAEDLAALADLVVAGHLRPAVRPVAPTDVVAAHDHLDQGRPVGRLVLDHATPGAGPLA